MTTSRSAGGSSGGAAAALASRMLPLADGSDYAGSLRNPAGWNNVFGFRTGFGVVPATGPEVWLPSMGVQGPMARSVEDLALLLSVQAGYDPRSPLSLPGDGAVYRRSLDAPVKGRRIGWLGDFGGEVPHEPEVLDLCRAALKTFEALGLRGRGGESRSAGRAGLAGHDQAAGLAAGRSDPRRTTAIRPSAPCSSPKRSGRSRRRCRSPPTTSPPPPTARTTWSMAVNGLFGRYDYLVLPSSQLFPFPVDERWPKAVAGHEMRTYHEWMKSALLVTLSGNPALVVPAGFGAAGLPIGLQIVGPNRGEIACLQLANAYEAATRWTEKMPPPRRA